VHLGGGGGGDGGGGDGGGGGGDCASTGCCAAFPAPAHVNRRHLSSSTVFALSCSGKGQCDGAQRLVEGHLA
jgi:hypothetical protein